GAGVGALQAAVVQPQHAVLGQPAGQLRGQLLAAGLRVALVQAAPGGQQGAGAVGLDGAALQGEVDALARGGAEQALGAQCLDQAVVAAGLELAAPGGEAEVQDAEASALAQGDR